MRTQAQRFFQQASNTAASKKVVKRAVLTGAKNVVALLRELWGQDASTGQQVFFFSLNAYRNGPTCAHVSGPIQCAALCEGA